MNSFRLMICSIFLLLHIDFTSARFDRVGFVSDPVKLLLKDAYASLRNRDYESYKKLPKQIRKRKYSIFPPTFYSSFGFGPMPFTRRQMSLPYTDLLFSGR